MSFWAHRLSYRFGRYSEKMKDTPIEMLETELEEILKRIEGGSDEAFEMLSASYEPLVKSIASSFDRKIVGEGGVSAFGDLHQELVVALYKAAVTFRRDQKEVTFGYYAKRCLLNRAISYLRKVNAVSRREARLKRRLAEDAGGTSSSRDGFLSDVIGKNGEIGDVTIALSRFGLSELESTAVGMYLGGMGPCEISRATGKSERSINNALYRARSKIRRNSGK